MASHTLTVHGTVTARQAELLDQLDDGMFPQPVHLWCAVDWGGDDLGVSFFKPGVAKRSKYPDLRRVYEEAPGHSFAVVLSPKAMEHEAGLVVTASHELEHLRQETRCRGILDTANTAREFWKLNRALFPELPTEIHIPVNAHAERAAATLAKDILGVAPVRRYYEDVRPDLMDLAFGEAGGETEVHALQGFFRRHLDAVIAWAKANDINTCTRVERFLATPCT